MKKTRGESAIAVVGEEEKSVKPPPVGEGFTSLNERASDRYADLSRGDIQQAIGTQALFIGGEPST
jgi:hypothetical protein